MMQRTFLLRKTTMAIGGLLMLAVVFHGAPAQEGAPSGPSAGAGPDGGAGGGAVGESLGTDLADDAVIQYDPETGSIIVITDEDYNYQIARVIESLDKPVPQVLIKVLFVEVTHSKGLDVGIEGSFSYGSEGTRDSIFTDFGVENALFGGFYRILDDDIEVLMRALATTGDLELLSRPSVLTRNNETATITIGQEVPFIRNSRVTEAGQTINTVEYEDIGIILEVTPHITPERLVEMEVIPEISTLTEETVQISDTVNATVIAKRSAQTRVVVADGRTVVIGGLMEDKYTEAVRKVPVLGDIPLLGAAFRRTVTAKSKVELLIFLTPHVVTTVEELDRLSGVEARLTEITPGAFEKVDSNKFLDTIPQ